MEPLLDDGARRDGEKTLVLRYEEGLGESANSGNRTKVPFQPTDIHFPSLLDCSRIQLLQYPVWPVWARTLVCNATSSGRAHAGQPRDAAHVGTSRLGSEFGMLTTWLFAISTILVSGSPIPAEGLEWSRKCPQDW